jgi:hypothetical protein
MWKTLRTKYQLVVSQECTRDLLRQMDPVSVANRRQHRLSRRTYSNWGPNHIWHVDGYDKLRPYGFLISGCIDGYSRRLLWLECGFTNHDPAVIAGYYMNAVRKCNGFPRIVRTDCGTENVTVAAIQNFVMPNHRSHIYGTSPGNQRIEAWWSFYRRYRSQWWIELFENLVVQDLFHPGHVTETDILRFCFMRLLQDDLVQVGVMWNTHRIRPSDGARCPPGIPDELYFLPPPGARDCLVHVPLNTLPLFLMQQVPSISICENSVYEEYLQDICDRLNWQQPCDTNEALQLYFNLRAEAH